ncbi:sulfatase-like hydrolase/transferase [Sinorhizobium medicae]|uniref:Arylsulfatase n=4 Tax=Sinorhizobium medicae TaxID=110321 RepID=A0A6G1WNX4_9HYPH|nr:sulfatase [Sinorhizobium medicae WSM419]MBO1943785.1 arylsulfatase [Sinorhizobium medicae]MBO1964863.1 arylsulfatase [Sinorhizobium medicae]MDX0407056.1 sulfatase-like hydrolase/transferase [Sinorhizobium medicae]MDX0412518.1 sulfatase-like hydrolase/transferase [Sinorhizobium medicae]
MQPTERALMSKRPNIVLVLADDMGFSDLGCYGGEISTPNLDSLARRGARFTQFYNTARCSPSRASLLTGLHPHQTGIGILTNNDLPRGYPGNLNLRCATLAEMLKAAGYATCLSGKWHLASEMHEPNDTWPTRRGFDRFFGTLTGCGSFYTPGTLTRGECDASAEALDPAFFYTDAIASHAAEFVTEQSAAGNPFFLYAAFTAPHWPLHAHPGDIDRYRGRFDEGWDVLREKRMKRLVEEGILTASTAISARDPTQPAWSDTKEKAWQVKRMQAYAAQIERMDRGIGKIIEALKTGGTFENTAFIFLSDNGASPEDLPQFDAEKFMRRTDILPRATRDGLPMRVGNTPDICPGAEDTYSSYGRAWANLSNTPFRFYKRWVHEGGIATPLIVHWPAGGLDCGAILDQPAQLVDIAPTILEVTGASYPLQAIGREIAPLEGCSLLPALKGEILFERPLYWEHTGNAAIRLGRWKLVREEPNGWELYDLAADRTELNDVAPGNPEVVADLRAKWEAWAERIGVIPWEVTLGIYEERGLHPTWAAG